MKHPFLLLLPVLALLTACNLAALETPEGQCDAARKAQIVAESEGADADMLRRLDLAVLFACPAVAE